ncbi:hypothetical protein [Streptomyces sp. HUAS TT20]|uniref:hypothetical protein n=1 Tax=Streptomyces sp. HUAS TT20 TaxID=3447509 RepID=UPI0021D98DEE|nr:hypothetical protein [Streptomyces sp. HUAS 15-9]UXY28840.1 hypothetical protein N8I87_21345 [Streptomyces sp. HUAS 15-9]
MSAMSAQGLAADDEGTAVPLPDVPAQDGDTAVPVPVDSAASRAGDDGSPSDTLPPALGG